MKKSLSVVLLSLSLVSVSVSALTLSEARQQGRVGETLSGYIAPLKTDSETQALVAQINQARRDSYQQLANDNGLPRDEVAKLAGQKLVSRAQPGEYVQGINGRWLKK